MKIDWQPLGLKGAFWAELADMRDERGSFRKVFHSGAFESVVPGFIVRETFLTVSHKGVMRGMHFQLPPAAHAKIVVCLAGHVLDVAVDLRRGPDFGKVVSLNIHGDRGHVVALPIGVAHGYVVIGDDSRMLYLVETEYAPELDSGVLWSSIGFDWPKQDLIISKRDQVHPTLEEFSRQIPDW